MNLGAATIPRSTDPKEVMRAHLAGKVCAYSHLAWVHFHMFDGVIEKVPLRDVLEAIADSEESVSSVDPKNPEDADEPGDWTQNQGANLNG